MGGGALAPVSGLVGPLTIVYPVGWGLGFLHPVPTPLTCLLTFSCLGSSHSVITS